MMDLNQGRHPVCPAKEVILMPFLLICLGALPLAVGGIMNWAMLSLQTWLPPFLLISLLFLLVWGLIAFLARPHVKHSAAVILPLNLIPLLVLLLLGVQELILHAYWLNPVGRWTQYYYLPLLRPGFLLTSGMSSVFAAYCAAFLLMLAASALGCMLRKR